MMDSTTGDSTTQNSLTNATAESVKSPKVASHHVIDVDLVRLKAYGLRTVRGRNPTPVVLGEE